MTRSIRLSLAALVVLGLGCPAGQAPPSGGFATPREARQFVTTRLLAGAFSASRANTYASSWSRTYTLLTGETQATVLVAEPAREWELALGFLRHGLNREALWHLENLVAYYPTTTEGRAAQGRLAETRNATVLGRVAPMSIVLEDGAGRWFVPAVGPAETALEKHLAAGTWKKALDVIHQTALERGTPEVGPLRTVAMIDDEGAIVPLGDMGGAPGDGNKGVVSSERIYYVLPPQADSLQEAEVKAKLRALTGLLEESSTPNAGDCRRVADALLYLGQLNAADKFLEIAGDPRPTSPLVTDLEGVAQETTSPIHLDGIWLIEVRNNPSLTLSTRSAVTTGKTLPVTLDVHAID